MPLSFTLSVEESNSMHGSLDAYVGGGGEWATGADDDDDYENECVAETWRDGGVLSEADA